MTATRTKGAPRRPVTETDGPDKDVGTGVAVRHELPAIDGGDLDAEAKRLLDDVARKIGRDAVNHLKAMYPDALKAVAKNAEVSLTNHVRNNVNMYMRPLVKRLVEQRKKGFL